MKTLPNKIPIPEAGEDILETLEASFLGMVPIIPAASVAEAEVIIPQLVAAGRPISTVSPVLFITNARELWVYDGDVLRPTTGNYYHAARKRGTGVWHTLAAGGTKGILACPVPVRPYDRVIICHTVLNIDVGKGDESVPGYMYGFIEINGEPSSATLLDEATTAEGAFLMARLNVAAGVDPKVALKLKAGGSNMKWRASSTVNMTMFTEERPVSMNIIDVDPTEDV